MIKRIQSMVATSVLGGLLVILPATIVAAIFLWIFRSMTNFISPAAGIIGEVFNFGPWTAQVIALTTLFFICFILGVFVKTRLGAFVYRIVENNIFYNFPGYKLVKDAIGQFFGGPHAQFSRVALVKLYDGEVQTTAFITASHKNGSYTVFVPTAPNPTSGLIFHLPADRVKIIDVSVEKAMRTVLACGAGSQILTERV